MDQEEPSQVLASILMFAGVELVIEHTPLCKTARYEVVAIKFVAVKVVLVFAITFPGVAKLSSDDSHLTTVPVCPDNVKTVLFVPEQTVVPPKTAPPTVAKSVINAPETVLVTVAPQLLDVTIQ